MLWHAHFLKKTNVTILASNWRLKCFPSDNIIFNFKKSFSTGMCMCGILPMIHSFRIPKVEATGLEIWAVYLAKTLQESAPEADLDRCGASNRNQIPFQKKIHSLLVDHFRSFFSWSHPKKGWLSANRFMVPKLLILGRLKGVPRNYPALRTEPTPQEAHSGLRPWTHP